MYTVVEEVNGMPVYKIKQESSGTIRTLHRNHLDLVSHIDNRKEQNSVNDNQETEEKEHAVSAEDWLGRTDNAVAVDESEEKQNKIELYLCIYVKKKHCIVARICPHWVNICKTRCYQTASLPLPNITYKRIVRTSCNRLLVWDLY